MKKQSKIRSLSTEDQNRIRQLCDGNTYDAVVELVAKPREQGGLDLKPNRSALSRRCSEHGTLALSSQLADQFLNLLEKQPLDLDDLISPMAHLVGQSAFLLLAQHRPFEEYRRP